MKTAASPFRVRRRLSHAVKLESAVAQAIGPLRTVVAVPGSAAGQQSERRYLVLTATGSDQPVLQQQSSSSSNLAGTAPK